MSIQKAVPVKQLASVLVLLISALFIAFLAIRHSKPYLWWLCLADVALLCGQIYYPRRSAQHQLSVISSPSQESPERP
jgi:hypothetical protein